MYIILFIQSKVNIQLFITIINKVLYTLFMRYIFMYWYHYKTFGFAKPITCDSSFTLCSFFFRSRDCGNVVKYLFFDTCPYFHNQKFLKPPGICLHINNRSVDNLCAEDISCTQIINALEVSADHVKAATKFHPATWWKHIHSQFTNKT